MRKNYIQPNTLYTSIEEETSILEISAAGIENPPTPGTDTPPSGPTSKENTPQNYNVWDD